jgi:ATP phosphoribosyltransferase
VRSRHSRPKRLSWLLVAFRVQRSFNVSDDDKVVEVCELKYSKATSRPARWVLAVRDDSDIQSAKDMDGMTVATELPITTKRYFESQGVDVNVEYSWGTTEVKAKGKLVDGIVDITETGSSLRANNLKIVGTIMESTTRFIANKEAWADPARREKIQSIALLLQAAIDGKDKVGLKANIPRANMDECLALMPAETAPTVADLTDSEYVSAEIVCTAVAGREITPKLYALGARGILMYPLNVVVH